MEAKFFFCLFLFPILMLAGCYSVEFRPVPDYPVLKKSHPREETELRFRPPSAPYDRIGVLFVYDAALDLQDESFRDFLKAKIRSYGADGAYVDRLSRKKTTMLEAQSVDSTNHRTPTGRLEMEVGTLRLILYCYRGKDLSW